MKRSVQELGFVPRKPVGVACLGCDQKRQRLVVCRTNGIIESWTVNNTTRPYVTRVRCTPAVRDLSFRSVAFIDSDRFVVGTLGGQILIYRYDTLELLETVASLGGAVWSLDVSPNCETVAVACEDARARFFHVVPQEERSTSESLVLIPRATTMVRPDSARLLAVRFSTDGQRVYTSDDTGHVMCTQWREGSTQWETDVTTTLQTLASREQVKKAPKIPALVWTITEVEGYIVCGASTGEVKFLDPHTGVLLQSIRTHKSDILTATLVDCTVFVTGVDNILTTLNVWEGEWVKSEGRNWGVSDCTSLLPLDNGLLLSGHLDGCVHVCETRKMFPAKAATSRASVFHYHQPPQKHTHPYFKVAAQQKRSRKAAKTKADEEVRKRMIASVDDFAVTLHRMPRRLHVDTEKAQEESEIVTELRYEVTGRHGIQAFDMDPLGRGFVFSTAERTSVALLRYDGTTVVTEAVDVLPEWESDATKLPAATSLKLHPRSGSLILCHAGGVQVIRDIFSPSERDTARAAQILTLQSAPARPERVAVSPCATFVVFSSRRCSTDAAGEFSAFRLYSAEPGAAQQSGSKRKRGENGAAADSAQASAGRLCVTLPSQPTATKTTRKEIADMTTAEVNGEPVVFVVLVDGTVSAYSLATGKSVFGMDKMPQITKGMVPPNRCDGSGTEVLIWNSEWFAIIDLEGAGYTEYKVIDASAVAKSERRPAKPSALVAVRRAPLQCGHLLNRGKTLLLAACSQEQLFNLAPPCFWRKQYAT